MRSKTWTILAIVLTLILIVVIVKLKKPGNADEGVAKCIGQNSELYIQLGCHACATQEEKFGENYKYLNVIDCFYEGDKCIGKIEATPTWIIRGEKYVGVQSIENLKELTEC